MMPLIMEAIGAVAGMLTTLAFLPQVIHTWTTRSAGDFSYAMLVIFASGVFMWVAYGLLLGSRPLIIANGITFALVMVILAIKIIEHRRMMRPSE